ncbi:MAG: SulP family inorganic anion transporter [Vicinamibacterales bacterium]
MFSRLFRFDLSNLRGDLFGGVTAGIVALPLALAFGVQSGLGAAAGIYGAMALGLVAAWLGGTPSQVSGPTGPMTVVSTAVAANVASRAESPEQAVGAVFLTFFVAGVFQVVLGLMRVGKYIRYVPYPVVSGFMTGIGVIIILLQVFPILGHPSPGAVIDVLLRIAQPLSAINLTTVTLAALTYGVIVTLPRVTKAIPATLVALLGVTGLSVALGWDVPRIGEIPQGLPALHLAGFLSIEAHLWSTIVSDGIALAALGAIDSLLTSLVADSMTRTRHDSEQELFGQGVGNMAAALIGGLPGAGATMRTVVNIGSGGRTRISGMVHGLLLLAVLLGLGRFAAYVPLAVLAGILVSVGLSIMDRRGIQQLRHVPRADAAVLVLVLVFTVFFDLIQAVALGVALASLLFLKRMGQESSERSRVAGLEAFVREPAHPEDAARFGEVAGLVTVKYLHGPLHFGFTSALQELAASLPSTPYLVIRMGDVPFIDQSGLNALFDIVADVQSRGTEVFVTEMRRQPAQVLRDAGLAPGVVPGTHVLSDVAEVVPLIQRQRAAAAPPAAPGLTRASRAPVPRNADLEQALLARNREWSERMRRENPGLFAELARHQQPFCLWIGCSDSRVPPDLITGTMPGDMFIHRNVANMVVHTDMNLMSVLDYGVSVLGINDIIVCGHYGCGGVKAAMGPELGGLAGTWVRHIRDVIRLRQAELDAIPDERERFDRIVELNVVEQVYDLSRTVVLRQAWAAGRPVRVHGWVYHLSDGLIKDLGVPVTGPVESAGSLRPPALASAR